jgi:ribose transport system substrate-binding protein
MEKSSYTIGFANTTEKLPFAVTVREGLEAAVAQHPNLTLITRDNDQNSEKALANAHEFAEIPVDLAMIYHIDERIGGTLRSILANKGIPIIAVTFPIPLAVFFGIDNKKAGLLAGEALGKWVQENWGGQADHVMVLTNHRVLDMVRQRLDYALLRFSEMTGYNAKDALHIDTNSEREVAARRSLPVFERWNDSHRIAVIGINDDTVLGALDTARSLGREADVAVVGQNASLVHEEFGNPHSRLIASIDYHPEKYGEYLVDLALRMLRRERVPGQNFVDPTLVTPATHQPTNG